MQYKTDATVVDIILFSFVGMECEMEASLKGAARHARSCCVRLKFRQADEGERRESHTWRDGTYLRTARSNFSRQSKHSSEEVSGTQNSPSSFIATGRLLGIIPDCDPIDRLDRAELAMVTLLLLLSPLDTRGGDEDIDNPLPKAKSTTADPSLYVLLLPLAELAELPLTGDGAIPGASSSNGSEKNCWDTAAAATAASSAIGESKRGIDLYIFLQ